MTADDQGECGLRQGYDRLLLDACVGVVVALVLAVLLKTFVVGAAYVPSGSMERTLFPGDFVLVNKLGRSADVLLPNLLLGFRPRVFRTPYMRRTRIGEIVLFRPPASMLPGHTGNDVLFLKRCIAAGGDTVEFREGRATVNRRPLILPGTAEAWNGKQEGGATAVEGTTVVSEDCVFLLGDNPSASLDSRIWGCVREDQIVGSAVVIYWSMWPPGSSGGRYRLFRAIRWDRIGTIL